VGLVFGLAGCSTPPAGPNPAAENIRQLAVAVGNYARTHKGNMPANMDELKKFVRTSKDASFAQSGEELFVSPRDNQPYVLVSMAKMPMPGEKKTVILNENTGVNGYRYVAYELGQVEELDAAKFQELVPSGTK
jgi:hypothetical protein